jgi:hypothetical protein
MDILAHCNGAAASVCQCASGIYASKVVSIICLAVDCHCDHVVIRLSKAEIQAVVLETRRRLAEKHARLEIAVVQVLIP